LDLQRELTSTNPGSICNQVGIAGAGVVINIITISIVIDFATEIII